MDEDYERFIYSAFEQYISRYNFVEIDDEIKQTLEFFRFVNSGKYVIGLRYEQLMRYKEPRLQVLQEIETFLQKNQNIELSDTDSIVSLFILDFPAGHLTLLKRKMDLVKNYPKEQQIRLLICFLYVIFFVDLRKPLSASALTHLGPFSSENELADFCGLYFQDS